MSSAADSSSETKDVNKITPLRFLQPFLRIMMSDCTDGPSTRSAISSVIKFITYNFINAEDEKCDEIVAEICIAIHNTRFIGSDASSDETVLMKNLVKTLILSPVGIHMSNDAICLSIQSCFRICFQPKLSDLLRSVCFSNLAEIVHHLFSRMHLFDSKIPHDFVKCDTDSLKMGGYFQSLSQKLTKRMPIVNYKKKRKDALKIVSTNENDSLTDKKKEKEPASLGLKPNPGSSEGTKSIGSPATGFLNDQNNDQKFTLTNSAPTSTTQISTKNADTEAETDEQIPDSDNCPNEESQRDVVSSFATTITEEQNIPKEESDSIVTRDGDVWSMPYNVVCLCEFLQYVSILIDPYDKKENQGYIVKNTVDLLHVAVESCLEHIPNFPLIMDVLKNRIFFNLFQNFLIILVNIASSPRHTYSKREHVLDCLSQILTLPTIVSELFANFDCNPYREDVVLVLVNRLRQIIENSTKSSILREFATDNLLLIVESLACDVVSAEKESTQPKDSFTKRKLHLIGQKCKKNKAFLCCEEFNKSTSSAVKLLQKYHIIEQSDNRHFNKSLGQFLYRYADRLDKKVLGEFLGKRNNGQILAHYLRNCDLSNMNIEQALRSMLHYFRLPGESPVISLILDQFSAYFLELNPNSGYQNHDAVFTLAYAIIMLNVDQHNENAKQTSSMTCDQFIRNVKGINNGNDFPLQMLTDIYKSVHDYEIILPEEREGPIREIYFWNRSLERSNYCTGGDYCATAGKIESDEVVDCHQCSRYIIFDDHFYKTAESDAGIEYIKVSFAYEIFQVVWQSICSCLSLSIGEAPEKSRLIALINAYSKCICLASKAGMIDIVDDMMSKLIEFSNILNPDYSIEDVIMSLGFSVTTRITCQVAFKTVVTNGDFLRDSWSVVLRTVLVLFRARLLPDELLQTFDFLSDTRSSFIVQPYVSPQSSTNSKGEYVSSSSAAASGDNSNFFSSIYQFLVVSNDSSKPPNFDAGYEQAVKFIKECQVSKLVWSGKKLQPESLMQKLRAIVDCYFWLGPNDSKSRVFLLEVLARIVMDNCWRFTMIWTIVKNFFYKILTACSVNTNSYLVEKIMVTLLRILIHSSQQLYNHSNSEDVVSCVDHFSSLLRSLVLIDANLLADLSRHLSCGIFEHIASNCDHITSAKDWVIMLKLLEIAGAGNVILNKAAMFSVPVVIPSNENSKNSTFNWTEHDAFNEASHDMWTVMSSMSQLYLSTTTEATNLDTVEGGASANSDENSSNNNANGPAITILDNCMTISHTHFLPKNLQSYLKAVEICCFLTSPSSSSSSIINNNNTQPLSPSSTSTTITNDTNNNERNSKDNVTENSNYNYYINYYNFVPVGYCLMVFAQASYNIHAELLELEAIKNAARDGKKNDNRKAKPKNNTASASLWSKITPESLLSVRQTVDNSTLDIFKCVNSLFNIFMDNSNRSSPFYLEEPSTKLAYCRPFLRLYAFFCVDEREHIRNHAYERMYVLLQGKHLRGASAQQWEACFYDVLLPLLASVLQLKSKITPPQLAPNFKTAFLKIMSMVGKIFLQNISILHELPNFEVLWLNLLQLYVDLLNVSHNDDIVVEAIPEMIKNILFVMFTLGVFEIESAGGSNAPATTNSSSRVIFFNETYTRIKQYLPSLRENLLALVEQKQNSTGTTPSVSPPFPNPNNTEKSLDNTNNDDNANSGEHPVTTNTENMSTTNNGTVSTVNGGQ